MLPIVIFGGIWLVPGFGWNISSVFLRLIVSPMIKTNASQKRIGIKIVFFFTNRVVLYNVCFG